MTNGTLHASMAGLLRKSQRLPKSERKIVILVVDDNSDLLRILNGCLTGHGFEVAEASDGIDALSFMYATRPDILLIDLVMPRMNGLELIRQVRSERAFRDVLVVAMSGAAGMLSLATEAGASEVFCKPFDVDGWARSLRRQRTSSLCASDREAASRATLSDMNRVRVVG